MSDVSQKQNETNGYALRLKLALAEVVLKTSLLINGSFIS